MHPPPINIVTNKVRLQITNDICGQCTTATLVYIACPREIMVVSAANIYDGQL